MTVNKNVVNCSYRIMLHGLTYYFFTKMIIIYNFFAKKVIIYDHFGKKVINCKKLRDYDFLHK